MRTLFLGLSLLLSGPVAAQAASYTYIDQKAPFKNPTGFGCSWPVPWLTALNLPRIGTTFSVRTPQSFSDNFGGGCPKAGTTWIATGVSNPDLRLGQFWGFLFTSAEVVMITPSTLFPRMTTVNFTIPNSSQLLGVSFYQQVLVSWLGAPKRLTRGGVGVIGR